MRLKPFGHKSDRGSQSESLSVLTDVRDDMDQPTVAGSPFQLPLSTITPGQLAFSALQFLSVPVIILDSLKTVVMANEAMVRLLGILPEDADDEKEQVEDDAVLMMNSLRGQTLSQVGVDLLQGGRLVWVNWEQFFDHLTTEMDRADGGKRGEAKPVHAKDGDGPKLPRRNTVVEVILSRKDFNRTVLDPRSRSKTGPLQTHAKMIITIWEVEHHQQYFTLTFTHTDMTTPAREMSSSGRKAVARGSILDAVERRSGTSASNSGSVASSHGSSSPSYRLSPAAVMHSSSPFPPLGPPTRASVTSTPSILQKTILLKDALLDSTQTPIVTMWKDGSVMFPNRGVLSRPVEESARLHAKLTRMQRHGT